MKLGYSITSSYPRSERPRTISTELLGRVALAQSSGFDYVQSGDHHVRSRTHYYQNIPTTARLSAVFDHVATMVLVPLYNPILMAEQIGTLAAFVEQVDFWCAIGYGREAFSAFGVPFDQRVARFTEGLDLMKDLWTRDTVEFEGDFYSVSGVGINPKFLPRICVGGGAEPAIRRAASVGDAWVAAPSEELNDLERKIDWYAEAGGETVVARRDVLVLEDAARANQLASELLADGYRGWSANSNAVISGNAADFAAALDRLSGIGVDEVVVRPMSLEHASETIQTIGSTR